MFLAQPERSSVRKIQFELKIRRKMEGAQH